jgi:DNA-directed RNA polymerase subunit M/transcription elongation factor TFIIS
MSFSNATDEKRNKCVKYIDTLIQDYKLSQVIEQSLYNYIISLSKQKNIKCSWRNTYFVNLYNSKIRSIYSNLKSDSYIGNKEFLKRVKSKQIDTRKIGELSVYEIFPENWQSLIDTKIKRDKIKYELKQEAMTDLFKCRKCGSRETSYYEVQTRSADEPMTQFITCLTCKNHWKQ